MSDDDARKERERARHEEDLRSSRDTYNELVADGLEAVEKMKLVAYESEHPRAYEVLSKLMKDTADIADKLMEVNRKYKDVCQSKPSGDPALPGPGEGTVASNNNFFIGSTTDLQRMLIDAAGKGEKDITPNGDS